MENFDAISLGISIGLGLLSIGLGIFAIWLSHKFSENSSKALDAVKDLARETRTLVELNLDQQKSFSGKMLDSILEQNKFGVPENTDGNNTDTINKVITSTLKEVEEKINNSVENELRKFAENSSKSSADLQSAVEAIKNDISSLNDAAPAISSAIKLPNALKKTLVEYQEFPAHYVLLQAIVSSNAKSIEELEKIEKKYSFPKGWEEGIENLIGDKILKETSTGFEIPEEHIISLKAWVEKNSVIINELKKLYSIKEDAGVTQEETDIGNRIKF